MDPSTLPASHILHPSYSHRVLQSWSSEFADSVPKAALVWPLFLLDDVRAVDGQSSARCVVPPPQD